MKIYRSAIIVACSQAKRQGQSPGPAIDIYDGPWWRSVRKQSPLVPVFALSAKYGLVESTETIGNYDLKLPAKPGDEYLTRLLEQAQVLVQFDIIWVCVPQSGGYAVAVEALQEIHKVFLDVCAILRTSEDLDLLERSPHFARTRALAMVLKTPSFMPMVWHIRTTNLADYADSMLMTSGGQPVDIRPQMGLGFYIRIGDDQYDLRDAEEACFLLNKYGVGTLISDAG